MKKWVPPELRFDERLASLRKERGLTQHALAEMVDMQISQIRRYEGGQSQPTLDAIRKLGIALSLTADLLSIAGDERAPKTVSNSSSKPPADSIPRRRT